jgi:hypothetical protein
MSCSFSSNNYHSITTKEHSFLFLCDMLKCRYILFWDVSWKGRLGKSKQLRCGIRKPKRPNFQIKSTVEKRNRIATATPLVASEILQLRAANCKPQFNRRPRFAIFGPGSSNCRCTNCYTKPWRWYQKSFGFVIEVYY